MKNFTKQFFYVLNCIPGMRKIVLIAIILLFSSNIFPKEIVLAKISKRSYTGSELEEILSRYKHSIYKRKKQKQHRIFKDSKHFILPINGKIISNGFSKGIYIKSKYRKTKVKAAKSGTVIYAGFLKYFGKIVIIKHNNGYKTVYTYLKKLYIKKGDVIYQGEYIGEKYKKKPLYFEVRKKLFPVNILKYYSKLFHGRKISRIN